MHESFSGLMAKLDDSTREKWSLFVSGRLAHVNERNTIVPHNSYSSNAMSSSEDEDTDFKDVTFPQESSLQQVRFCVCLSVCLSVCEKFLLKQH